MDGFNILLLTSKEIIMNQKRKKERKTGLMGESLCLKNREESKFNPKKIERMN